MNPQTFYEVKQKGESVWGGASAYTAVQWFRKTRDAELFVSVWNEEEEDYHLLIEPINISPVVLATLLSTTGGE